jgi:hypothetical protein
MPNAGYADDPTIPDPSELWRRIPPKQIVPDENLGGLRPSSAAFDNHRNGSPMSVHLADVLAELGRGPNTVLVGHDDFALAAITAGLARECGQGVARDPLPEEPAHGLVFGKKTKAVRKILALGYRWVIPPRGA